MYRLYAHTIQFYIRNLSVCRFWYLWEILEQIPNGYLDRSMYVCMCVFIYIENVVIYVHMHVYFICVYTSRHIKVYVYTYTYVMWEYPYTQIHTYHKRRQNCILVTHSLTERNIHLWYTYMWFKRQKLFSSPLNDMW